MASSCLPRVGFGTHSGYLMGRATKPGLHRRVTRQGEAKGEMPSSQQVEITIGPYEIVGRPDVGDALTYIARKPSAQGRGKLYLLHVIQLDEGVERDLEREVQLCAGIQHPAKPHVVDFFQWENSYVLAFEHVDGVRLWRLKSLLERTSERLHDEAVWYLGLQVMGALARAHVASDAFGTPGPVIHGRVNPRRILISWEGRVMLIGLGLPSILEIESRADAADEEAAAYLAPEQREGRRPTPGADVYGAAVVLWSLLTGRKPPPDVERLPLLRELRPDLPEAVAQALDLALEPSLGARKIRCVDVERELRKVANVPTGKAELRDGLETLRAMLGLWSMAPPRQVASDAAGATAAATLGEAGGKPLLRHASARWKEAAVQGDREPLEELGAAVYHPAAGATAARAASGAALLPKKPEKKAEAPAPSLPPRPAASKPKTAPKADALAAMPAVEPKAAPPAATPAAEPKAAPPAATPATEPEAPAAEKSSSPTASMAVTTEELPDLGSLDELMDEAELESTGASPPPAAVEVAQQPSGIDGSAPVLAPPASAPTPAGAEPLPTGPAHGRRSGTKAIIALGAILIAGVGGWLGLRALMSGQEGDDPSPTTTTPSPRTAPSGKRPAASASVSASTAASASASAPSLDDAGAPAGSGDAGLPAPRDAGLPAPRDAGPDASPPVSASATGTLPPAPPAPSDGTDLLSYEGYLLVRSSATAEVFVQGKDLGPTNTWLRSRCTQRNVRIGLPGPKWLSATGLAVRIACRGLTDVTIEPDPVPPP